MNGEDLFRGLSHIDEDFIAEAETVIPSRTGRKRGLIFLIAAVISLLGVMTFASTMPEVRSNWFYAFFEDAPPADPEEALTENQSQLLHAALVEIGQSVSSGGYTITLESGLCDGYRALIKCRLEGPEGTVLGGRNYALDYTSHIDHSSGIPGNYSASSFACHLLEDPDPTDNRVTLLLEIIVQPGEGSAFSLADGTVWELAFSGIEELTGTGEEAAWNTLCRGTWEFRVAFQGELLVTESIELLRKPVRCLWSLHVRNFTIPVRAKIFSFELRSLTATIRYKRPLIAVFQGVHLDKPIYLVLHDGTRVRVQVKMTTYRKNYDETLCLFDRPVSPEDIACIEFPGVGQVAIAGEDG